MPSPSALRALYYQVTGDPAPAADVARQFARLPFRRRRAVELRLAGRSYREIGKALRISHGSARSRVTLALRACWVRLLGLPRYHQIGHPPPPVRKSKRHETQARPTPRRRR